MRLIFFTTPSLNDISYDMLLRLILTVTLQVSINSYRHLYTKSANVSFFEKKISVESDIQVTVRARGPLFIAILVIT